MSKTVCSYKSLVSVKLLEEYYVRIVYVAICKNWYHLKRTQCGGYYVTKMYYRTPVRSVLFLFSEMKLNLYLSGLWLWIRLYTRVVTLRSQINWKHSLNGTPIQDADAVALYSGYCRYLYGDVCVGSNWRVMLRQRTTSCEPLIVLKLTSFQTIWRTLVSQKRGKGRF
jgi:hypothetical protein